MGDRAGVVVVSVPRLAHPRDHEHLVVHREPEEHREQEDRHPSLHLARTQAREMVADAPLEEDDEQPVDGGDGEGVEQDRLERDHERPERPEQHEVRREQRRQHDPRKGVVGRVEEVDSLRRRASGRDRGVDREARRGDVRPPEPLDERPRLRCAVLLASRGDQPHVPARRVDVRRLLAAPEREKVEVLEEAVAEPVDRLAHIRAVRTPGAAGVDDDGGRRDDARPDPTPEQVVPARGLELRRYARERARREAEPHRGQRRHHQHGQSGREEHGRPSHHGDGGARPQPSVDLRLRGSADPVRATSALR